LCTGIFGTRKGVSGQDAVVPVEEDTVVALAYSRDVESVSVEGNYGLGFVDIEMACETRRIL
jgi:hypothetical protein